MSKRVTMGICLRLSVTRSRRSILWKHSWALKAGFTAHKKGKWLSLACQILWHKQNIALFGWASCHVNLHVKNIKKFYFQFLFRFVLEGQTSMEELPLTITYVLYIQWHVKVWDPLAESVKIYQYFINIFSVSIF